MQISDAVDRATTRTPTSSPNTHPPIFHSGYYGAQQVPSSFVQTKQSFMFRLGQPPTMLCPCPIPLSRALISSLKMKTFFPFEKEASAS